MKSYLWAQGRSSVPQGMFPLPGISWELGSSLGMRFKCPERNSSSGEQQEPWEFSSVPSQPGLHRKQGNPAWIKDKLLHVLGAQQEPRLIPREWTAAVSLHSAFGWKFRREFRI